MNCFQHWPVWLDNVLFSTAVTNIISSDLVIVPDPRESGRNVETSRLVESSKTKAFTKLAVVSEMYLIIEHQSSGGFGSRNFTGVFTSSPKNGRNII